MLYGWTKEYILENLNFDQLNIYYKYGMRYDLIRHGFKVPDEAEEIDYKELRKLYYTPEEIKAQEEAIKKQYGDIGSEINGDPR